MEIRDARRDDWPGIERLVRAAWHDEYATTTEVYFGLERLEEKLEALREEFDAMGSRFLVAIEGDRPIGAVLARLEPGRVWIDDLFVAPESRRKGVGRELVRAVSVPDLEVCCEVNRRNEAGLQLYRALGFEVAVETAVLRRPPQA